MVVAGVRDSLLGICVGRFLHPSHTPPRERRRLYSGGVLIIQSSQVIVDVLREAFSISDGTRSMAVFVVRFLYTWYRTSYLLAHGINVSNDVLCRTEY